MCNQLKAEESDTDLITIYATVCEDIHPNESTSSTRMRATDKACFKALENIGDLSSYRSEYDTHNYNVLIYKLIDTYLEDLTSRTTSQNDTQLCVEVTGFLNKENILLAIEELANQQKDAYPKELQIENNALTLSSPNSLPPKPEIKINDEIAVEKNLDNEAENLANVDDDKFKNNFQTNVFIETTKFFNDTSTNAFQQDIAQILEENKYIKIVTSLSNADYIIKTKVLRAKVDPINKQTNRLQMVIAIELTGTKNDLKLTEHQNRFILFENAENEQSVATSLLRKLLRKATKQILPKIKTPNSNDGSIITPQ